MSGISVVSRLIDVTLDLCRRATAVALLLASTSCLDRASAGQATCGRDVACETKRVHHEQSTMSVHAPVRASCGGDLDALLCDGFDDASPLSGWTREVSPQQAWAMVQSDDAVSRPASFVSFVGDVAIEREARIRRELAIGRDPLVVSFALGIEPSCIADDGRVEIAELAIDAGWTLRVVAHGEALAFVEARVHEEVELARLPFAAAQWHRAEIRLDLDHGAVAIALDEEPFVRADVTRRSVESLTMALGARQSAAHHGACVTFFDDVQVTNHR
jgi:hypothetical protein